MHSKTLIHSLLLIAGWSLAMSSATGQTEQPLPEGTAPDTTDEVVNDSWTYLRDRLQETVEYYRDEKNPDASRSALYSALLPGAGQVYNRESWKLGLVYGGIGLSLYNISRNRAFYNRFQRAYEQGVRGEATEFEQLSTNAIRDYRDQFRKRLELNYIGLGAVYVLNILDAFIFGHLKGFDVSEDLSFELPPGDLQTPYQVSLVYRF